MQCGRAPRFRLYAGGCGDRPYYPVTERSAHPDATPERSRLVINAQPSPRRIRLTPEEDAIIGPEEDGDIDDTMPGDLWFRRRTRGRCRDMPVY